MNSANEAGEQAQITMAAMVMAAMQRRRDMGIRYAQGIGRALDPKPRDWDKKTSRRRKIAKADRAQQRKVSKASAKARQKTKRRKGKQ